MASLEDLLATEGFKRRSSKPGPRILPPPSRSVSMPLHRSNEQSPFSWNSDSRVRRNRVWSDVYIRKPESIVSEKSSSWYGASAVEIERGSYNGSSGRSQSWRSYSIEESKEYRSGELVELEEPSDGYQKNYSRMALDVEPALDEAATLALVSILTSYIRPFFKDDEFRSSIRRGCDICLGIDGMEEGHPVGSGALANLKEAITTVEKAVQGIEEVQDPMELKKASFKLSVITGLSSNELRDNYSSEILNLSLVACAHIYLGVIYKLQQKDTVAAKHLLQVFCESPNQARRNLMTGLWDRLFSPHFSQLKTWYEKEGESIPRTAGRRKKLELLEKAYDDTLDTGTYQFALYYREWLMEDSAAPILPSIQIPFAYLQGILEEDSHLASSDRITCQPMVSKKLYKSLFCNANEFERIDEMRSREEEDTSEGEFEDALLARYRTSSISLMQDNVNMRAYPPKSGLYGGDYMQKYENECYSDSYDSPITVDDESKLDILS